jgi:hypothetical protein
MAISSLVGSVRVSSLRIGRRSPYSRILRKLPVLLLLLLARPAHAQTSLTINTHWADGAKCSCTVIVKQTNANGTTTQVFEGVTDSTGHLTASLNLQVQGVYSLSVSSNAYDIPVFSLPFSTGLVSALPLKSATLNLVFNRPSVNGTPIPCCNLPATYTAPTLASGTAVQFGI